MNHDPSPPLYDERRENVWAVLGAQVLHAHRPPHHPSDWPRRSPNATSPEASTAHPLDVAYEHLSALPLDDDAADIDLVLEAVRAERLKGLISQYQDALLERLGGSPEDRAAQKARGLARYGRDYLSELQADALSPEELAALLPWPAGRR